MGGNVICEFCSEMTPMGLSVEGKRACSICYWKQKKIVVQNYRARGARINQLEEENAHLRKEIRMLRHKCREFLKAPAPIDQLREAARERKVTTTDFMNSEFWK